MNQQPLTTTGTITPNWQLHIPVNIRQAAGLTQHGRVEISVIDKAITIKPQSTNILDLASSVKTKTPKHLNVDKLRDHIDYSDL